jgi:alkylation response protein AidB-like acyl-CoA dehydrogenase
MLGRALPVFQLCQGAIGVGLAEAAFQAAQRHVTATGFQHTGTKLMDLPNIRSNLAQMRLETDKARAYLVATLDKLESSAPDGMLHVLALKASSGETAVLVSDIAMRTCGGAAFSKHLGLERVFRDARAAIVMAPTTDHLREFVGRLLVGLPLFG